MNNLKEAKTAINEYLNIEVETLLFIVRQRTNDGATKAAKVLAYKLKKTAKGGISYTIKGKYTKVIRG